MSRMAQGGRGGGGGVQAIRKWSTNSNILESKIKVHEADQCEIKHIVEDHQSYAKLSLGVTGCASKSHKELGQAWDNKSDEFKVGERSKTLSPTKRNLLSVLASLFDPIGIVRPVIVCAKILFQEVCKDKNFTEESLHKWEGWYRDLIETKEITTPRCINIVQKMVGMYLAWIWRCEQEGILCSCIFCVSYQCRGLCPLIDIKGKSSSLKNN